jgi:peptidoglycan glycosyltransferase
MNKRISRLGIGLIVAYLALFTQLNRIQVLQSEELNAHPENFRNVQRDFDQPRGRIETADLQVVARSVPTPDGAYGRLREYPAGELFAHVTGSLSLEFGADGVERTYNDWLSGQTDAQQFDRLSDLFIERDRTGDVTLTLIYGLQDSARAALGARRGSVVLLDPRSGELLALWSWPSYDPNLLASHDADAVRQARDTLLDDPANPMQGRAYQERYFPGSTFKVVTAAVGVESGLVSASKPVYPARDGYVPPASSAPLRNFGGSVCGGSLVEILRVSCNTAFAEMGAETLGPDRMVRGAADFGFNSTPPLDLPATAPAIFPTDYGNLISGPGGAGSVYENSAALAQASIGQNDVQASPLSMALVAAAVANNGAIRSPHVVGVVRDAERRVLYQYPQQDWRQAMSPAAAATMRTAMEAVVDTGTARDLRVPGLVVGAKTGTAQVSGDAAETHAWVIGYAGVAGRPPALAFAVMVEADPALGEQTGGGVAVPIAATMLQVAKPIVEQRS